MFLSNDKASLNLKVYGLHTFPLKKSKTANELRIYAFTNS